METTVVKKIVTEIKGTFTEEDVVNILTEHLQHLYDLKRSEVQINLQPFIEHCGDVIFTVNKVEQKTESEDEHILR